MTSYCRNFIFHCKNIFIHRKRIKIIFTDINKRRTHYNTRDFKKISLNSICIKIILQENFFARKFTRREKWITCIVYTLNTNRYVFNYTMYVLSSTYCLHPVKLFVRSMTFLKMGVHRRLSVVFDEKGPSFVTFVVMMVFASFRTQISKFMIKCKKNNFESLMHTHSPRS